MIGRLPDTLEDRSLEVRLTRKKKGEPVRPLRKTPRGRFNELRSQILRWVTDCKDQLKGIEPPVPESLDDRAADNWFPLLAIAQIASGEWLTKTLKALRSINHVGGEDRSVQTALLLALRDLFKEKGLINNDDFIPTEHILQKLNADKEAPWADWRQGNAG
jgi:putative DNA primase/helicase